MSERAAGVRIPDAGALLGRGDANITDFLAQQQGAADLADFALQSTAGASLASAAYADGSGTSPLTAVDTVAGAGTFSLVTDVVDPVGVSQSVKYTPDGVATQVLYNGFTLVDAPTTPFLRFSGGLRYHRVSHDAVVRFSIYFEDNDGNDIERTVGGIGYQLNDEFTVWDSAFVFTTANADTWLHTDIIIPVPPGATQVGLTIEIEGTTTATVLAATELLYFNNLQFRAASQFAGALAGTLSQGAAWLFPWGTIYSKQLTTAQTLITTEVDVNAFAFVDFTAIAGRRYRVSVCATVSSTVAGDTVRLKLTDSSANQKQFGQVTCTVANSGYGISFFRTFTCGPGGDFAAGEVDLKMRCLRQAGTGTISVDAGGSTAPTELLIEDIGPWNSPPEGLL